MEYGGIEGTSTGQAPNRAKNAPGQISSISNALSVPGIFVQLLFLLLYLGVLLCPYTIHFCWFILFVKLWITIFVSLNTS